MFKDRVGEINYNKHNTPMKIIKYNGCEDMIVEFQDKHRFQVQTRYDAFKKGQISNPFDKTVFEIGYLRSGKIY